MSRSKLSHAAPSSVDPRELAREAVDLYQSAVYLRDWGTDAIPAEVHPLALTPGAPDDENEIREWVADRLAEKYAAEPVAA